MPDNLKARDGKDVEDTIRWALAEGKTLAVEGRGSQRALGRPSQSDFTLDLSGLSGVTLYEPEELVLSARAGTPLAEIEALLEKSGQQLDFEPVDLGRLLGGAPRAGSIGGALATNFSGPRRLKAGAARDHFLGFTAVSGRGETFKSGGRVVKNVTGYDLSKIMAGSFGTLGAMTDVTLKTLPRAEMQATLVLHGLTDAAAMSAMAQAMGSSADVSGAAHLPANIAAKVLPGAAIAATLFRLEGVAPSVTHRTGMLADVLKSSGASDVLNANASDPLWRALRDAAPFDPADGEAMPLWRISTAPMQGAALGALIAQTGGALFYDWGGGLIWAQLPSSGDAGAEKVRAAVAVHGGHATLIRAPVAVRAAVDVFQPQEPGIAALTRRVKESFDPKGVLNPGRMWAGV